jgi:ferric-chelate reductase
MRQQARIEGPYITEVPELKPESHVLAIVGGTGTTGALSLADLWTSQQRTTSQTQQCLKIVWSIRDIKMADLAEIRALQERFSSLKQSAELQIHVSSQSGRLQPGRSLDDFVEAQPDSAGSTFVYISGPEGLATSAEAACVRRQRRTCARLRENGNGELSWHNATFTV